MGLSSSQARLLSLTSRMHSIEYKAAKLEAQKLQMANESRRVYDEYLEALDSTKIQRETLDTNGSVKYVDATYNDLCFGGAVKRFVLRSVDSGKPIIPENVATKFEANRIDPAAFATAMTGYVPTVIPEFGYGATYAPPIGAEEVTPNTSFSIAMGEAKNTTISSTSGITLTLSNGYTTENNEYTIKSKDGSAQDVTFQYLQNGRLIIFGNGLQIDAVGSHDDDIILIGDDNIINTGAGNDIVRVGFALGQDPYKGYATGNEINTGSGIDHVALGQAYNTVINAENVLYMSSDIKANSTVSVVSNEWTWYQSSDANISATSLPADKYEGPSSQGSVGDCRLFAAINSLGRNTNNGDLSAYVTISGDAASGYSVTFKNYPGSNKTATITASDVQNTQNVTGDLTTILIDLAINKLMTANQDDDRLQNTSVTNESNAFARADYNTVALYLIGNRKMDWSNSYAGFETQYNKYTNPAGYPDYTNLIVSFRTDNAALGIVSGHAYSVKNKTAEYVEIVNPWDDTDVLRISTTDFELYYKQSYVFGAGTDLITYHNSSIDGYVSYEYVDGDYTGGSPTDEEWNYFYNLHRQIANAGGYEIISAENTGRTEYLSNMISSGYAYLVEFDGKTNSMIDTSVSVNTSLKEVSDETMLRRAEAKYEADMRKIDAKDRKYDIELAAIESERNAIKSEMETLKTVAKDNVERTFKLFS